MKKTINAIAGLVAGAVLMTSVGLTTPSQAVTLSGHAVDHSKTAKKSKKSTTKKKTKKSKKPRPMSYFKKKKYTYKEVLKCIDVAVLADDYIADNKITKREKKIIRKSIKRCATLTDGF